MKYTLYTSLTALFVSLVNLQASNTNDQDFLLDSTSHSFKNESNESDPENENTQTTETQSSALAITLVDPNTNEQSEDENSQANITMLPREMLQLIFFEVSPEYIHNLLTTSKYYFDIINSNVFKKNYIDNFVLKGRFSPELKNSLVEIEFDCKNFINTYVNKILLDVFKYKSYRSQDTQSPFRRLAIGIHVPVLFTEDMRGYDRPGIIDAFATMSADEIGDRIHAIEINADTIFTDNMSGKDRSSIIRALAATPLDRMNAIVQNASRLFKDNMTGHRRSIIITNFATVPADEIADRIAAIGTHEEFCIKHGTLKSE